MTFSIVRDNVTLSVMSLRKKRRKEGRREGEKEGRKEGEMDERTKGG
jgi:hypothetical protein